MDSTRLIPSPPKLRAAIVLDEGYAFEYECPLWVKRDISKCAPHTSAYDPKRTSVHLSRGVPLQAGNLNRYDERGPSRGGGHEAARVHQITWRRDGGLAVFSACTAIDEADNRVLERPLARRYWASIAGISQGFGRSRIFRRSERDHRIQLGSRRVWPAACVRCRICAAARERTRGDRRPAFGPSSEASNLDDPDRVCVG